ncbi:transcriptional repressor DicA [Halobacillus karajensis]|uniref:Transcriptional repressor DicA n=2 Tax=Halobacillus karajensis TaxID=195088 RepID=A0A059NUZ0_9BACI|nr:transcriptional repressor DicA [Halobacillus karajensis]CDQ26116.1 transcriptional repressor DicA [Halobacillus karajensis]
MTQKELGDAIGVRHNTISQYEKGRNAPEQNMIFAIANVLGVSVGDFFPETTTTPEESFVKAAAISGNLDEDDYKYLQELIKKAHTLEGKRREDFFKNIRLAVEFFDRNT